MRRVAIDSALGETYTRPSTAATLAVWGITLTLKIAFVLETAQFANHDDIENRDDFEK